MSSDAVSAPLTVDDLLQCSAELVAVPSESFFEAQITELIQNELAAHQHLELTRVGDNLVARTQLGRPVRVILAGHTDT
ncbi:MAG: succinyl-diaminopimelate desuccinylase, partial [Actinobacteria bacterium]|nr:succinyl-diaminopimelate desuccinylase [Actinomycetota bacterium]